MCLKRIWPHTSTMADISWRKLGFLTHMPWAQVTLRLYYSGFLLMHVELSRLMRLKHIWPCTSSIAYFSLCKLGFPDLCLRRICPYSFVIVDFFLRGLSFPNSHVSCIIGFTSPSWRIYLGMSWVSQLTRLRHIWPCASIVPDFYLHRLDSLDLCILDIFGLATLSWQIYLSVCWVFWLTHVERIWPCISTIANFSSCGSGFLNLCVLGEFSLTNM